MIFQPKNIPQEKRKIEWFTLNLSIIFGIALFSILLFVLFTVNYQEGLTGRNNIVSGTVAGLLRFEWLPLFVILLPLLSSPLEAYLGRRSENMRDSAIIDTTLITFIAILALYPQVARGGAFYSIPGIFGFGLSFRVDLLSFLLTVIAGFLWLMVSMYAHDYMGTEKHRNRFYLWYSITFAGVLGTLLAGDFLTLFLFFELMTFSSYLLVAHNESRESLLAGGSYIFMGVAGGLCILLGIMVLYSATGSVSFTPFSGDELLSGAEKYTLLTLFIVGFGVKAGMLPVHIWLPKAHPVAPTPASALLSGVLIKIGAYGLLKTLVVLFQPQLHFGKGLPGALLIIAGLLTMSVGVFFALRQNHLKKLLAYSSISQMGYIILGFGIAFYLGGKGAMGFAGGVYHILNHALLKALLFLIVGVIYLRTKELDLYKLGGLRRKMPLMALFFGIAFLGITGMPGFNAFASKSLLHHAVLEAAEYGNPLFRYAEYLFILVSAGTFCTFLKLWYYAFAGEPSPACCTLGQDRPLMKIGMGGLALVIVLIGIFPQFIYRVFLLPAAFSLNFSEEFIVKYLSELRFFTLSAFKDMFTVYLLGIVIFLAGVKYDLFRRALPRMKNLEELIYQPLSRTLDKIVAVITRRYEVQFVKNDVVIYVFVLTTIIFILLNTI